MIEKKKYDHSASEQVKEAMRKRVTIFQDKIILYDEIPIFSPFSIEIMFSEMTKLANQFNECAYIIDISETQLPDAETRRILNKKFKETLNNVKHVAFVTGKNFIINTAAKFVMFQTNLDSFSINKTREEAVENIKKIFN